MQVKEKRELKDFKNLLSIIGTDKAQEVLEVFEGCYIYIPKKSALTRETRNATIYDEYKKSKDRDIYRILAKKYDLTEHAIRRIIREILKKEEGLKNNEEDDED